MTMEKMNYSKSIQRLEEIVKQIESGDLELDQLSNVLKEANLIIEKCKKKLKQADEEVKKIMQSEQDSK